MAHEKRLIYVDEVIRAMQTVMSEEPNQNSLGCRVFAEIIKGLELTPTVDAVEVVRCKDCKHGVWDEDEQMWTCVYSAEFDDDISEWFGFYEFNEGEHFCSRGERKDNV